MHVAVGTTDLFIPRSSCMRFCEYILFFILHLSPYGIAQKMPVQVDETWGVMVLGAVDSGKTALINEVCFTTWMCLFDGSQEGSPSGA
jgi:hypothetical protein